MKMEINIRGGKYVVAVSGGIDSVVLLDALARLMKTRKDLEVVVAHFDHGIRPDSKQDRLFVQSLAGRHGLPYEYERVELGAGASEAVARSARYAFLRQVRKNLEADMILTAHHQDDVIETIIINWSRGTRSRGLSSLRTTSEIGRPLLEVTKEQIRAYAQQYQLEWREDSTNADDAYLRNYIRSQIMPHLSDAARVQLLSHRAVAAQLNDKIDRLVADYIERHTTRFVIDRPRYCALPEMVSREVLAEWLRRSTDTTITTKTVARIDTAIRVGRNNSLVDVSGGVSLHLSRADATLVQTAQAR